ncbi:MAG: Ku protein, partial [Desulfovibrionales bacterium]
PVHGMWNGTISFGLVSIPVALFPANRSEGVSLRMLAPDGTPLKRRYYCPKEGRPVQRDEIVRGYEIKKDEFVVVTDEELESLEPKKTREIDLRRFVPVEQLDAMFFDRPYFLVPTGQSEKPYRLLAQTMERTGRAGIATFVMRTREYLVAILSEGGILRAETLRFADEIRTPEDVGLPVIDEVAEEMLEGALEAVRKAAAEELDLEELSDPQSHRLLELARKKRASGQGVVQPLPERQTEEESGKIIDLMEVLKQSLAQAGKSGEQMGGEQGSAVNPKAATPEDLQRRRKSELYEMARDLGIPGRSVMSKNELVKAIQETEFREIAEA